MSATKHLMSGWNVVSYGDGKLEIQAPVASGAGVTIAQAIPDLETANTLASAPDLLEAVELFLAYDARDTADDVGLMLTYADALDAAKKAAAKAKGVTP